MSPKDTIPRPQEELLGRSTPFPVLRLILVYLVLLVAVAITTTLFVLGGVMDTLQVLLTLAVLFCVVFGIAKACWDWKREIFLYDTWFQVGRRTYSYDDLSEVQCQGNRVFFRTGEGPARRCKFYAGNARALAYLLERKRKETQQRRAASPKRPSSKS